MTARGPALALAAALAMPAAECAAQAPAWSANVTGYYYSLRDQSDYLMTIATAERGPLLLEARYNYEALDTGSVFVGWKFSGGEAFTYELTPILGVVLGKTQGVAPGFKASAAYGIVDFYVEAEYLRDTEARDDSFTYAWSELGFSPAQWLRFGLVGQRTRAFQSERSIERGVFAQWIAGKATLGLYVFNPGDGDDRVVSLSLGVAF